VGVFIKPLSRRKFEYFRDKLDAWSLFRGSVLIQHEKGLALRQVEIIQHEKGLALNIIQHEKGLGTEKGCSHLA
jgi:hypothetical protein